MSQTVTLRLPDKTLQQYRRGARAAHKSLSEFLAERLHDSLSPLVSELPTPVREELEALERLDDEALLQVAQSHLGPAQQRVYSRLLRKQEQEQLTAAELDRMRALGEEARRLTLRKAHAYLILKWRGHGLPAELQLIEPE